MLLSHSIMLRMWVHTSGRSEAVDIWIMQEVRTVQEGDFGRRLLDVNYFHALRDRRPQHRVFVCP
jgi:hypothetical protein